MRVYVGADHAGYELKVHLVHHLVQQGYEVVDVGPPAFDADDAGPALQEMAEVHKGLRRPLAERELVP